MMSSHSQHPTSSSPCSSRERLRCGESRDYCLESSKAKCGCGIDVSTCEPRHDWREDRDRREGFPTAARGGHEMEKIVVPRMPPDAVSMSVVRPSLALNNSATSS